MSRKTMLITGSSRGIGKACYDKFKDEYDIITVHRGSDATYCGDLIDIDFRTRLINEVTPDVFINNCGGLDSDPMRVIQLNAVAACHLMMGFHQKMSKGIIVNISSIAANNLGWSDASYSNIAYSSSKAMLSLMSTNLHYQKSKNVKVITIEPGQCKTERFAHVPDPIHKPEGEWDIADYAPLLPNEVADAIAYTIKQDPWVNITMLRVEPMSKHFRN